MPSAVPGSSSSVQSNPHLLVCAHSPSAVEEIIVRLKKSDLISNGKFKGLFCSFLPSNFSHLPCTVYILSPFLLPYTLFSLLCLDGYSLVYVANSQRVHEEVLPLTLEELVKANSKRGKGKLICVCNFYTHT